MNTTVHSNGLFGEEPKKEKKSKLIGYAIPLAVVAICLVAVYATFGVQAAQDWNSLKANLDPDWTPTATETAPSHKVVEKKISIGTAGGD